MGELAQANAKNTRYAVLNICTDPVTFITIYSYQAGIRHCDSRFPFAKHIFLS